MLTLAYPRQKLFNTRADDNPLLNLGAPKEEGRLFIYATVAEWLGRPSFWRGSICL